jgi:hypothetical protein
MNERLEQAKLENECEAAAQLFVARALAEMAITLLINNGTLPLPVVRAALEALIETVQLTEEDQTQAGSIANTARTYLEQFLKDVSVSPLPRGIR